MSDENVELVRRIYSGWGAGDFRIGWDEGIFDDHVLLVVRPEFGPEAGVYRGLDEIRVYTQQLLAAWDDFAIAGEEFLDGGESVVVRTRQTGTGKESGAPAELSYFHVWTFRAGTVIRVEAIRGRAAALETAGLTEAGRQEQ